MLAWRDRGSRRLGVGCVMMTVAWVAVCGSAGEGAGVGGQDEARLTWSKASGLHALMYAYTAYCTEAQVTAWSCRYCGHHGTESFIPMYIIANATHNSFGFVGYERETGTAIVSFRGTVMTSLKNWISDLVSAEMVPLPGTGVYVGEGFLHAWLSVRAQVHIAVRSVMDTHSPQRILVTGHSLGAALATLAVLDIKAAVGNVPVNVITFGDPRVGDASFAKHYVRTLGTDSTIRVTWKHDLVPHLPPEALGFVHVPTEVWGHVPEGSRNVNYTVCDGSGEDPYCSDSVAFPASVFDHLHYMGIYENGCIDVSGGSTSGSSGTSSSSTSGGADGEIVGGGRGRVPVVDRRSEMW
ncbi:uncharacterized protein AMSG_09209 [Thecamonas trahens ATCC 50062]|uniref:Fungal lipase-type domain-containing protein n=1 Tax=Thecamonas trahens ATCC 50062 TaxID=461836 RepID=A0A0L0DLC1_THETB|nr:hypothetical protein AMSG_09209 [Thecamonas trahens ATCC 50062]KNC53134.1 hypothetical protein AMSG_09209 [Thecamonas trahens ATCC 50062]|eukprot:XP_013754609.1 hypothetical protein AMSG_09209 [Thecamonas trahens ATCC 50062]